MITRIFFKDDDYKQCKVWNEELKRQCKSDKLENNFYKKESRVTMIMHMVSQEFKNIDKITSKGVDINKKALEKFYKEFCKTHGKVSFKDYMKAHTDNKILYKTEYDDYNRLVDTPDKIEHYNNMVNILDILFNKEV